MNRDDLTIVYYTSNRENWRFERRIIKTLLRTSGGLPIISVSQKPIDLGTNICVGDIGVSSQNAFRQFQIGAIEAKTKFVCPAEADFIYPKEYFQFVPPREDTAYLAFPVWVVFAQRGYGKNYCLKPRGSEAAMVVGREIVIKGINRILKGRGQFGLSDIEGATLPYLLHAIPRNKFIVSIPILTFKTSQNMHHRTPHKAETKTLSLPHYGEIHDLLRRYMG